MTKARIRDIHALGFHVSLDDFGSGFSSLGMLMEFDVDAIRLDRRFFADMENLDICCIHDYVARQGYAQLTVNL